MRIKQTLGGFAMIAALVWMLAACGSEKKSEPITPVDGDETEAVEQDTTEVEDGDESEADSEAPLVYPEQPADRVVYEIYGPTTVNRRGPCNRLPLPYDYFTREDASAPTGKRIDLRKLPNRYIDCTNSVLIDDGLFVVNERYVTHMNALDGFSAFGAMLVEVTDLDTSTLPATPEASAEASSLVWLVNIDPASGDYGKRAPITIELHEALDAKDVFLYNYLWIRPVNPIAESSKYALVLLKGLKTKAGAELKPSAHFQLVSEQAGLDMSWPDAELLAAERDRLAPALTELTGTTIGLNRSDLLLAIDFTTQSVSHDISYINAQYESGALPKPEPSFDITGDGKADFYTEETLATYPGDVTRIGGGHWVSIGGGMRGSFTSSDFRSIKGDTSLPERRRDFRYDDEGNPIVQTRDARLPFTLYFPKTGQQPFPLIMMQHGIYSDKEDMYSLSAHLTSQGYAVVMMDFPYHGERKGEGYGGMPPIEFIDYTYPLKARGAFVQASLDQSQLIRIFTDWDGDYYPNGTGDGVVDIDKTRIGYFCHSLGGIVGSLTASVTPEMGPFVNIAGGGGLIDFINKFMVDYGMSGIIPEHTLLQLGSLVQTVVDAGDNVHYIKALRNPPQGSATKAYLLQEMEQDEVMPHAVSENIGRIAQLPILNPVLHAVPGLQGQDGPLTDFGLSQFTPGTHQTLVDTTHPETNARMISQYQHFYSTYFTTGHAEIIAVPAEVTRN